jgi:hypothetical protein
MGPVAGRWSGLLAGNALAKQNTGNWSSGFTNFAPRFATL